MTLKEMKDAFVTLSHKDRIHFNTRMTFAGTAKYTIFLNIMITLFSTVAGQRCIPESQGETFVYSVPPNRDAEEIGLFIQPVTAFETNVVVTVPLRNIEYSLTLDAGSGQFTQVLPSDLVALGVSGITDSTIVVESDHDISLISFNARNHSTDTFTISPQNRLSNEYFVAVYPGPSFLTGTVQISALSEPSAVTVTPKAHVTFNGVTYNDGDVINYDLSAYEVLQLDPSSIDFTGTRIVANTSVSVVIGSACANIPETLFSCDHLCAQAVPFDRWGKSFVISPFPQRQDGYICQVVAGRDGTIVTHFTNNSASTQVTLNMGEYYQLDVTSQRVTSITANQPIQVAVYSKGTSFLQREYGDPSMLFVPPQEQYVHRVEFAVPQVPEVESLYFAVTAECDLINDILLDDVPLSQVDADELYMITLSTGVQMCISWYTTISTTHVLSGILTGNDVMFTALVYGFGVDLANSHYVGFNNMQQTCLNGTGNEVECSSLPIDLASVSCIVWELAPNVTSSCVAQTAVGFGSTCSFACETGFALQGSDTTTCGDGGYFSGCPPTCLNEDECSLGTSSCDLAVETCTDTIGSFQCDCAEGFERNNNGNCIDIDECARNTDDCQHNCDNTQGSFDCSCRNGFLLEADGKSCEDINECSSVNDCAQLCSNVPGSYTCSCNSGYSLDNDDTGCTEIDECTTANQCDTVNGDCENTAGSFLCTCKAGWILDSNGLSCSEENECLRTGTNYPCDAGNGDCRNNVGSYQCTCNDGWELTSDDRTCQDINECATDNNGCALGCTNTLGSFSCLIQATPTMTTSANRRNENDEAFIIAGAVVGAFLFIILVLLSVCVCFWCCRLPMVEPEDEWDELRSFAVIANPSSSTEMYRGSIIKSYTSSRDDRSSRAFVI